jgi:ribonuclease-3
MNKAKALLMAHLRLFCAIVNRWLQMPTHENSRFFHNFLPMPRTSLRYHHDEFEVRVRSLLASLQIRPNTERFALYFLAFVHRSALNETYDTYRESNERLEYLGDAVLELIITEALFYHFPSKPEGELTDIRSALVRGRNLAEIAKNLNFSIAIQVSRGEFQALGHENPYILANTFEAVIGAMYLDQGIEKTREFVLQHVFSTLEHILQK